MLCMLLKTIKFRDFNNEWVTILADTEIYVDVNEGIAYDSERDIHFTINKDEYTAMS